MMEQKFCFPQHPHKHKYRVPIVRDVMKKIILASLLALSSAVAIADTAAKKTDTTFAQVEKSLAAKDYKAAYTELERLSKAGNAQATYGLASLTASGQGTTKDEKKALKLFEESANKNFPLAQYTLGHTYLAGQFGVKKDVAKGKSYLDKASKQGFEMATLDLAGLLFSENTTTSNQQAVKYLKPLIDRKNPHAIYLNTLYDIDQAAKAKDKNKAEQALKSLQGLATQGYAPALASIGSMFISGNILEQNLDEAKKIFTELDKINYPTAKAALNAISQQQAQQKTDTKKKG